MNNKYVITMNDLFVSKITKNRTIFPNIPLRDRVEVFYKKASACLFDSKEDAEAEISTVRTYFPGSLVSVQKV